MTSPYKKSNSQLLEFTLGLFFLAPFWAFAQVFSNQTNLMNVPVLIPASQYGNGVSVADINGDGLDDISFCTNNEAPLFFINDGNGFVLTNISLDGHIFEGVIKHLLWVDYDNDGDKDLFVSTSYQPLLLFNNQGDLNFVDVSTQAGLSSNALRYMGCSWGDYDKDGYLDLYVCKYYNPDFFSGALYTNDLYHNNGDGTFTESSNFAGVTDDVKASFQSQWYDYDGDGWLDLLVINSRYQDSNSLFRNLGDGTFEDVSAATGMDLLFNAMSTSTGDYDNDGDFDVYITNSASDNHFMEYDSEAGSYSDVTNAMNVDGDQVSWGALWIDADLDMDVDLYVPNTLTTLFALENQNLFYENLNGESFSLEMDAFGLTADDYGSYTASLGDFNGDGWPDFVQANNSPSFSQLYYNSGTGANHHLKINLEGVISNRDAIGTLVEVYANNIHQSRFTKCGENYLAQNSSTLFFGLKILEIADSVVVTWPSGQVDVFYDVPANNTLDIIEGSSMQATISYSGGLELCPGDELVLNAGDFASCMWSNGETTPSITVDQPGSYSALCTSAAGLTVQSDTVVVSQLTAPQITASLVHPVCFGGQNGQIFIIFDQPFDYQDAVWNNGDIGLSADSLSAGIHVFTITYGNNCIAVFDYELNEGQLLEITASVDDLLCYGDSSGVAEISVSGGTPPLLFNYFGQDLNALPAGSYTVEVTDLLGCQNSLNFEVNSPATLTLEAVVSGVTDDGNGQLELLILGGTPPFEIEWSTGDTTLVITDLIEDNYQVSVLDANGCLANESFVITDVEGADLSFFKCYPNPVRDFLMVESPMRTKATLMDLHGKTIASFWLVEGNNYLTLDSELSQGVYALQIMGQTIKLIKL